MTIRLTYPRTAAGVAAGIMIGLFLSGVAYAVTSNVFRYSTTQTGYYSIHASTLVPVNSSLTYSVNYTDNYLIAGTTGCFQAGLNLPDRAKLVALTVWYQEAGADQMSFRLFRARLNVGSGSYLVNESSTDTTGAVVDQSFAISGPARTINNLAFAYGFAVCFTSTLPVFKGARIKYTYTTAGG